MVSPKLLSDRSSAQRVLFELVRKGGVASRTELLFSANTHDQTDCRFKKHVIHPLLDLGFVRTEGRVLLEATDAGIEYARKRGICLPQKEQFVGSVVPSRIAKPFKPLDVARIRAAAPLRPGANDHLKIPSLMGNVRKLPNGEVLE